MVNSYKLCIGPLLSWWSQTTNLHIIGLIIILICCFRWIIITRRISVGVQISMGHRRRIEWRRIFPVVPVIRRMRLLLLIWLESIRVVGLGTGDLLWTEWQRRSIRIEVGTTMKSRTSSNWLAQTGRSGIQQSTGLEVRRKNLII